MAFGVNMQRAEAFLGIFDKPGGVPRTKGQPSNNEKELLRATVVFAVAALDAYLHDLVLEEATRQGVRSDGLAEALRTIAKEDPSLALRVAMADSKADRHTEFRAALGSWLSTKSFQGPEAVFRALGYIGKLTSQDALNARIRVNWAQELRVWTEMRHQLVHRAGKVYVKREKAGHCVQLIWLIEAAVESIAVGAD
jgi:hypothetical protein